MLTECKPKNKIMRIKSRPFFHVNRRMAAPQSALLSKLVKQLSTAAYARLHLLRDIPVENF
jgi:hypothetical protein